MSNLLERLKSVGLKSQVLSDSKIYKDRDLTTSNIPVINIAMSGDIDGGFGSGVTILAGPSKHFKSNTGVMMVADYLRANEDAFCLFYDSEFGAPPAYWANFGIDVSRVIHQPIENLEQLKFDLPQKLEEIKRGDKVIIFVDSIGNLASRKEAEDALDGKSTTDMTRAREMKSMFRIVTPKIKLRNLPAIFIAHTYQTMEMFSKAVVSGGTGPMYSADTVIIFGKQQDKDGTELVGFNFIMNMEKSRFVIEKSKIPLSVSFKNGISKYSGILDLALESGHVVKPKNGRYQLVDLSTGELLGEPVKEEATETPSFLGKVIVQESFKEYVRNKYQLKNNQITEQDIDSYVEDVIEEDVDE